MAEKTKREPIKVLEDAKIRIEGINLFLSATIYEPWINKDKTTGEVLPQKAHERVGFATIKVGKLMELNNISVFLNTEKKEYWLAFPNKLVKGKFKGINYIPKETTEQLNHLLNGNKAMEQAKEELEQGTKEIPWEMDL